MLEPLSGNPKVRVLSGGFPVLAHFVRSGVTPDDFEFGAGVNEGTHIKIDDESGPKWEIEVIGGQVVVTEL